MKTYKTTSTVTVVLANGETVVYDNAGLYWTPDDHFHVFSIASSNDIAEFEPGEYRTATRTIECREVKKRTVYIVRYLDGVETEHNTLYAAYMDICGRNVSMTVDSIRREEREKSV